MSNVTARTFASLALAVALAGCHGKPAPSAASLAANGGSATRRSVKTATDALASQINLDPQNTTIEDIMNQKAPGDLGERTGPFEDSTWQVDATVESVQLKKDGDYYLVLKDGKGSETVVEVPDPKQCQGSPLQSQIAGARKAIEDKYHPTSDIKKVHDQATVTGVGFLGWGNSGKNSKKKGAVGGSGPRLMPGTGIKFKP